MEVQENKVSITFKGDSFANVVAQAKALVQAAETLKGQTTTTATPATKKKAAPPVEEETFEAPEDFDDGADESMNFGAEETEEEPEAAPAKKAKKITEKDVNAACMSHAAKHGRPKTLAILSKKFKVKSILELKPEQYTAVLAALK